ncbi:hypothetical protein GTY41_22105, partial [Streptomyces sp. SID685]|nr:hypothetical protein [Streptomyces sp. SID685]
LAPPARKAAEGLRGVPRPVLVVGAAGAIALIAAGVLRGGRSRGTARGASRVMSRRPCSC